MLMPVDSGQLCVLLIKSGGPGSQVVHHVLLTVGVVGAETHPVVIFQEWKRGIITESADIETIIREYDEVLYDENLSKLKCLSFLKILINKIDNRWHFRIYNNSMSIK